MSDAASDAYKEEMMENQYLEVVRLQREMGYQPIKEIQFFSKSYPERMKIIHDVQKEYLQKKNESRKEEKDIELTNQFKTWFPNLDKQEAAASVRDSKS